MTPDDTDDTKEQSGQLSAQVLGRKRTLRAHIRNVSSLTGVVGPIILAATTLITHVFRENYDWLRQTISQLGLGPHSWIENTGFIVFGVLMVIFAEALYAGFQTRRSLVMAIIIWVFVGIGFITVGIFHADVLGNSTLHGLIHLGAARGVALLFPIVCFLLVPCFESDVHWDNMVLYTLITGIVALLLDLLHFVLPHNLLTPWMGLYERVMMVNSLAWLEIVAIRLLPHRRDLG